jgi:hypothetical protein
LKIEFSEAGRTFSPTFAAQRQILQDARPAINVSKQRDSFENFNFFPPEVDVAL